ncbi:MAG: hypothetical protein ACK559_32420, partial [bacterium]
MAIVHCACQLKEDFSISLHDGSTCYICQHDFGANDRLVTHLGLAHQGLWKYLDDYQACTKRSILSAMNYFRLTEKTVPSCFGCPDIELRNLEQAVDHLKLKHIVQDDQDFIDKTLQPKGKSGQSCLLCYKDFESWLEGLHHLENHHRSPVCNNHSSYSQLIQQTGKPICKASNVCSFRAGNDTKEQERRISCSLCTSSFRTRKSLCEHYVTHFKIKLAKKSDKNTRKSLLCKKKFTRKTYFLSHLREAGSGTLDDSPKSGAVAKSPG